MLAGAAGAAHADITLEERLSLEGAGVMRMANMSGTTRTTIAGDRSRIESDLQMQSRFVRMLARGALGPTAEIVRLDEGKVYQLDLRRKQYTEMSFEQLRAQLDAATQKAREAGQTPPGPIDESQCEWSEPKADVKQTGEKGTFAGYSAERTIISASQSCTDKKTGSVCEIALSLDQWLAPGFPGGEDVLKFQRAYAEKMGLATGVSRDLGERAEAMFGRYKGVWSEIASRMKDVKGYPVRNSFALAIGGAQCRDAQQAQEASSESAPAATPGGLAGEIGGRIAGALLRRKRQEQPEPAAQTSTQSAATSSAVPAGLIPMITVTSELVSVSSDAAAAGAFEVPADFRKSES